MVVGIAWADKARKETNLHSQSIHPIHPLYLTFIFSTSLQYEMNLIMLPFLNELRETTEQTWLTKMVYAPLM